MFTHSGTAPIANGMSTVTLNGLACGVTYTITAGGTLNGELVGPRSSHDPINGSDRPCEVVPTTTSATMTPMTSKENFFIELCM